MNKHIAKRFLTLLMVMVMTVGMMPAVPSFADSADPGITVYVTVSDQGNIVTGAGTTEIAQAPVVVTDHNGSGGYDIDDVLYCLHETYYSGGAGAGYGTSGAAISAMWGDHGPAFGYWVNDASAYSIADTVSDGDYITAFVYADQSGWSDAYAAFTAPTTSAAAGSPTTLKLEQAGYDASWNTVFSKCPNADISVIGDNSFNDTTDANGEVSLTFPSSGTYYVTAAKSDHSIVPAVCKVAVEPIGTVNAAPNRKATIPAAASASTYIGKAYTLKLSGIFEDSNLNPMTYTVSVDGAASVPVAAAYSYTPTAAGITTMEFTANDGIADSSDVYTVTLTTTAASASSVALTSLLSYFSSSSNVLPFSSSDSNTQWAMADVSAYSATLLSAAVKQAYVDHVVYNAPSSTSAGDLARYIITLKALGYDATKIDTNGSGSYFNAVTAMNGLIGTTDSIYTLPYLFIALQQYGTAYAPQIDTVITKILNAEISGGGWGYKSTVDPDAVAPVLLALAPYYSVNASVKTAVDHALTLLQGLQGPGGGIASWGSENAASTGLMIASLTALGEDPEIYLSKSLISGLMLNYNSANLFSNSFNNEEALRGLVAASKFSSTGNAYCLYDFSANASNPAVAGSYYVKCLTTFSVIPSGATVAVTNTSGASVTALSSGQYDLAAGTYNYSVSKSGYTTKTGSFTVSSTSAQHGTKAISVSLSSAPVTTTDISVKVYVKTHGEHSTGTYTYKNNSSIYTNMVSETVTLNSGSTVFDALDAALKTAGISYNESSSGYIGMIDGLSEFDHGSLSGWLYRVGNTTSKVSSRDYILTGNATVTWFYTDDYTSEYGSESWGSGVQTPVSAVEAITPTATVANGTATATVSNADALTAIETAQKSDAAEIVITPEIRGDVSKVTLKIPAASITGIADDTKAALIVKTDIGDIRLSNESLSAIAAAGGTTVSIVIEKADKSAFSEETKALIGEHPVLSLSILADSKKVSSFNGGSASVSVPYTPAASEDKNAIVVYYINDAGILEMIRGAYNSRTGKVNFTVSHFSEYAVGYHKVSFADVADKAWFSNAVTFLAARGITSGTEKDLFAPEKTLTRGQFIVMLMRAYGIEPEENGTGNFSDAGNTYYTKYLAAAKKLAISEGTGDNKFEPDRQISRQDMFTLLYRALDVLNEPMAAAKNNALIAFTDSSKISGYAKTAMETFASNGVITGSNGKIDPNGITTRAQMAQVLYSLLSEESVTVK